MPKPPDHTKPGSIAAENELVAVVTGSGVPSSGTAYVAVQSVRHTGKAWHCLATSDDGTVDPLTVDPKGRIHLDADEPDEPTEPVPAP